MKPRLVTMQGGASLFILESSIPAKCDECRKIEMISERAEKIWTLELF